MSTNLTANPTHKHWLSCRLNQGMFSDEIAVTYPPEGEPQKSVFVPSTFVDGTPGHLGRVLVRIVNRDDWLMAVLPSSSQDIVTIRKEDVVEA